MQQESGASMIVHRIALRIERRSKPALLFIRIVLSHTARDSDFTYTNNTRKSTILEPAKCNLSFVFEFYTYHIYLNLVEKFLENFLIFQVFLFKIPDKENILNRFLMQLYKISFFYCMRMLMLFTHMKEKRHLSFKC